MLVLGAGVDAGCLPTTSDKEIGKIGPALPAAAKIAPYFILALDGGPATTFGLGFVLLPKEESPREPGSGAIFTRNAAARES